ncbi:metallophosphoesterase [Crenobacter sp. SG2305]|uniref:metallophosphoesterase n=1 Tax=Crenobacter oryzisoli TaxID=3056844 RepID=UPI0025AB2713|nr:metallophosphoesterase [Crenobacter sp. SG2305]MDN0081998.1 metallophosphoesterase [Crenobacter sp. SG2305]
MITLKRFEENTQGNDWVVGDLHGCFGLLKALLREINFDEAADRLFSVGDLVDRGPDSAGVLNLLALPWLYSVRGNHEQIALDTDLTDNDSKAYYQSIGGSWFLRAPKLAQDAYRKAFADLPLAIEVATSLGPIGIVHADCPLPTWGQFARTLEDEDTAIQLQMMAQWSRDRIMRGNERGIPDLRALIVGHTPRAMPEALGNVIDIDTGAVYGNALTAIRLWDLKTISVGA